MMPRRQVWRRLGRVIEPRIHGTWWATHASYPTALLRPDGHVDVFFSVRDVANRSSMARVVLAIDGPRFAVESPPEGPLLELGPRGAFDADGVTVGCVLRDGDRLLAYYLGWSLGVSVPFTNFIGLAVGDPATGAFRRHGEAPIVGRSRANPFTLGYPWVLRQDERFRMWFGSHLRWGPQGLDMEHVVKQARSADGLTWEADERIVVPLRCDDPAEFAVSRPVVVPEPNGVLSMWYARRRPGYEIGYAQSTDDGETWVRADAAVGFEGSPGEWDDREQTYPCVFDHAGRRYMLYNGNGYGRSGFGLAMLDEEAP